MNTSATGVPAAAAQDPDGGARAGAAGVQDLGADADFRPVSARWVITAQLVMQSASQIGSHESDYCDQTFERGEDGRPLLRGTTLTGALRAGLRDRLEGYRSLKEERAAQALFGHLERDDAHESRLIVFDSHALADAATALRDGVSLVPVTGLAKEGAKYDREVCLPGVAFPVRFDLLVPEEGVEASLLELLISALEGMTSDQAAARLALGGRKTRGLGQCLAARFRAERYDLTTREGWLGYADSGYGADALDCLPETRQSNTPRPAVEAAWRSLPPSVAPEDQRRRLELKMDLSLASTLLIRSPGHGPDAADAAHLTEGGRALLSGTTLVGDLRRQARRILNTLAVPDGELILGDLFGPEQRPGGSPMAGSRLYLCGEPVIEEARTYRHRRTAIDRVTGATVSGALFEEAPCVGGHLTCELGVRQPLYQACDLDAPLLLLAARDLLESLLTVGGEASVGRGVLSGAVTATLITPGTSPETYHLSTGTGPADAEGAGLDALLAPLLALAPPADGENP